MSQKTLKAAGSIADSVTRQDTVNKAFLSEMIDAAESTIAPSPALGLKLKITGVTIDSSGNAKVLWSWNELLWPLVVSTRATDMPLAAALATLAGDVTVNYPVLMAASLLAIAPVLILFVLLQRRVIDGLASSGRK